MVDGKGWSIINECHEHREFVRITKEYPLAGAEAFSKLAPNSGPFRFVFVSGQGSTQTRGRFASLYSITKGEVEAALSQMRITNPRLLADAVGPGFVDAKDHAAIRPYLPNQGLFVGGSKMLLRKPIEVGAKWLHCPSEPMGRFLVGMALGKYEAPLQAGEVEFETLSGGLRIIKNVAMKQLVSQED